MQVIIVSHYTRSEWVRKLLDALPGAFVVVDFLERGAAYAHHEALGIAAKLNERCIIMEDDAIPVRGFMELAQEWIDRYPDELLSFYLGTSRPADWQRRVDKMLDVAPGGYTNRNWTLRLNALIHGVCYTIPPGEVQRVRDAMNLRHEADFTVGRAWGKGVVYPVESLVQHRDQGTVERHADGMPRKEPRVARFLAAPLMYERE